MYTYHNFFIHSLVCGHLGCFHVLGIVNSAEHWGCKCLFQLWVPVDICLLVGLLSHMVVLSLVFKDKLFFIRKGSQVALVIKNPPTNVGDIRAVCSILGQEGPLGEGMATHSSIPMDGRIPWTKEPGRLQPIGSQRVRHNRSNLACMHIYICPRLELRKRMTSLFQL